MSDTKRAALTVAECPDCGYRIKVPWSNRVDDKPGQTGDSVPEPGNTIEGIKCRKCERQLGFEVVSVRNVREIGTGIEQEER